MSSTFRIIAQATLESLADQLESNKDLDIDYDGKMLSIELNSGQVYLINFHELTNQIWVSSPISGAHHFSFRETDWKSTRDETGLSNLLESELNYQLQYSLDLPHA